MKHLLLLLSLLLLAGCWTRPPDDVRADRDRWTFYRDATADGSLTQVELDQSADKLADWNAVLLIEEKGTTDLKAIALEVALAVGDDFLRNEGTLYVRARYPELMPVIDADANGVITISDIQTLDPRSPRVWIALLMALRARG